MKNRYVEQLEQIIIEMKKAVGYGELTDSDHGTWLSFLRQVHPESDLLNDRIEETRAREPTHLADAIDTDFGKEMKRFGDVRDIMMLAEAKRYPTWFIQPKYKGALLLEYERGELVGIFLKRKGSLERLEAFSGEGVPKAIQDFTGRIGGTCCQKEGGGMQFMAYDVDRKLKFAEKMELLKSCGFIVAEHVLFPTDKLPTISCSKLEMFLQNYISIAQEQGLTVDGVVIISNESLATADDNTSSTRMVFTLI